MNDLTISRGWAVWSLQATVDHAGNGQAAIKWPGLHVSSSALSDYLSGKYAIPAEKLIEMVRLNKAFHVFRQLADALENENGAGAETKAECLAKRAVFSAVDFQRSLDAALSDGHVSAYERRELEALSNELMSIASAIKTAVEGYARQPRIVTSEATAAE